MEKKYTPYLVIILVLVVLGAAWKVVYLRGGARPDKNLYQVVLLANNQAYYGKLHNVHSDYPYLTEVFYLKPEGEPDKFTVLKRGFEIHSPTDWLYLNKKNILYWENVGPDSLVARGIAAKKGQIEQEKAAAQKAAGEPKAEEKK